jgi:aspartokinase
VILVRAEAALDRAEAALTEAGLPFKDLTWTGSCVSFVVPLLNVPSPESPIAVLERALGPTTTIHRGISMVSIVGDGLSARADALARFSAALRSAGAEPMYVSAGPLRLSALVDVNRADEAQRAIHRDLGAA